MRTQIAYIPGTLYDHFDINGKPLTKDQKRTKAIQDKNYKILHGGKAKKEFEPTELQIKKFNNWLEEFQEDIQKIIGKYRFSNHILSQEELTSEINLALLKKRSHIIEYIKVNKKFDQPSFKHSAFIFSRNLVKWSHMSLINKSYVARREDGIVYDKDSFKTTYEKVIEDQGVEDDGFTFDEGGKVKTLIKIIKEYSYVLSPSQLEIFSHLESGLTMDEVAKETNVTHQAISQQFGQIKDKIRTYFKDSSLKDNSFSKISKGNSSINDFFVRKNDKITDETRKKIEKIVHLYPNQYTAKDISKVFFENRYTQKQIVTCCVKMGWGNFLKKQKNPLRFSSKTEILILNMYKKGLKSKEISDLLNIPINSLRSKRGHFVCQGLLKPNYTRKRADVAE